VRSEGQARRGRRPESDTGSDALSITKPMRSPHDLVPSTSVGSRILFLNRYVACDQGVGATDLTESHTFVRVSPLAVNRTYSRSMVHSFATRQK